MACVQEMLEKSSSIVEMSSILLSLPFFFGGNLVLEIWEQGSKNECFFLYRYQEQINYRTSTDSAAHVKTQVETVSHRLNSQFGRVTGGLER